MKEEDAKTKWCPMVRQVAINDENKVLNETSYNRCAHEADEEIKFNPNGSNCIAFDCMMWRQNHPGSYDPDGKLYQRDSGYCGLGGKL